MCGNSERHSTNRAMTLGVEVCPVFGFLVCSKLDLWFCLVTHILSSCLWFVTCFGNPESSFHNRNKFHICRTNLSDEFCKEYPGSEELCDISAKVQRSAERGLLVFV